jgi:hypothetical protein
MQRSNVDIFGQLYVHNWVAEMEKKKNAFHFVAALTSLQLSV